jgi:molybdenum cofactor cytidylyltransferase
LKIAGLLLAAGRGSRFDATGQSNKLIAPLPGEALGVAQRSALNLARIVEHVVAVTRPDDDRARQALLAISIPTVTCPDAALGMGHSLAYGVNHLRQTADPDAIVVALADMPFIRATTLNALRDRGLADNDPQLILATRFSGSRGHPVWFGKAHFDALCGCTGDSGAASLFKTIPPKWLDVDRPADLNPVQIP